MTIIGESSAIGGYKKLGFMPSPMQNPFLVKLSAVELTEDSIVQYSFATDPCQTRNKKSQRPERDQCGERNEDNCGQLEIYEVSAVMEDVLAPGCRDDGSGAERDRREGRGS